MISIDEGALETSPAGESPDENVSMNEVPNGGSIINDEEDCGCEPDSSPIYNAETCWGSVDTVCMPDESGKPQPHTKVCSRCLSEDGTVDRDCDEYPGMTCKEVCKQLHIPYQGTK